MPLAALAAPKPPADEALTVQFDTIRDRRKKNLITHEAEIQQLVYLGKSLDYARAIADQDDVYLLPANKPQKIKVLKQYETPAGKVQVDTIRTLRVAVQIARGDEISRLLALAMPVDIATAIADNDDTTIALKPVKKPTVTELPYETDAGKLEVNNIRAMRVDQLIDRPTEISALIALEMPDDISSAMADADDFKIQQHIEAETKPVLAPYETEAGKLLVDTVRRARRTRTITADDELALLTATVVPTGREPRTEIFAGLRIYQALSMPGELAQAYVANDELRMTKIATTGG